VLVHGLVLLIDIHVVWGQRQRQWVLHWALWLLSLPIGLGSSVHLLANCWIITHQLVLRVGIENGLPVTALHNQMELIEVVSKGIQYLTLLIVIANTHGGRAVIVKQPVCNRCDHIRDIP
jgi:hypothetical protein